MRRRKRTTTIRRELAALGHPPHEPTDALRAQVRILTFNKVSAEAIALVLNIDLGVLRYWYSRELALSETEILAQAAANVLSLASQRTDLGVALRANELLLKTRSATWREPRPAEPERAMDAVPAGTLSLKQVEAELARLDAPRSANGTAAPREDPVPGQGKPH
jgi:hypothetical protein